MMHGFKNGVYRGWSPFFNYDSYESLKLSENLPIPNKKKYVFTEQGLDLTDLSLKIAKTMKNENSFIPLNLVVELLNTVKNIDNIYIPDGIAKGRMIKVINKHNSFDYSTDSLKNFVVKNIIETSNSPVNQISSYSPITFGKYEEIKKSRENNFVLSLLDGISMDQQQETNAVGKDVIGIAANGIKDYFALVDYFSNYYKGDINPFDNEYFERVFNLGDGDIIVNRIAGLNLTDRAISALNSYIGTQLGIENLFNSNSDPALVLSSLLSAATDNAKELILKAINAGKEFASMHMYLIILGFDEGYVAKFMTNPENISILEGVKHNLFMTSKKKPSVDSIVRGLKENTEFKKIFNLAKELTSLAKILKINQGIKASADQLYKYFQDVENDFVTRELQIIDDYKTSIKTKEKFSMETHGINIVMFDKPYLSGNINDVIDILRKAKEYGIIDGGFSFDKFLKDNNNLEGGYKDTSIKYYNLIKGTFNTMDILTKLKHFGNMINAAKASEEQIIESARKFRFALEEVPEILMKTDLSDYRSPHKLLGTNKISLSEEQISKAFSAYDDIVISNWLKKTLVNKTINLLDVKELTETEPKYFNDLSESFVPIENREIIIDFKSDDSLANFKQMMENNIVPYLKKIYPNNSFVKGLLIRKRSLEKDRTWISTRVRMGKALDPKNLDTMFNYQNGFDELHKNSEKLVFGNTEFAISDLFFLYNLIVNKDRGGYDRLTKIFKNYISDKNSLALDLYKYYTLIDSGDEPLFDVDIMDESMENVRRSIVYGIISINGSVLKSDDARSSINLKNPNFTMVTGTMEKVLNYDNIKLFSKVVNLLNDKNVLIQFNCD